MCWALAFYYGTRLYCRISPRFRGLGGADATSLPVLAELPAPPEEAWSQEEVQWRIRQWEQHQLLSEREAAIVRYFMMHGSRSIRG